MEQSNHWFLMKSEDESVFGPISTSQLEEWANSAQISPQDKISSDEKNWLKAPLVSFLKMDFLLETAPDQFYGPTTAGTIKEFLEALQKRAVKVRFETITRADRLTESTPGLPRANLARLNQQFWIHSSCRDQARFSSGLPIRTPKRGCTLAWYKILKLLKD